MMNNFVQRRIDVDGMGHVELIDAMVLAPLTKVDMTARVSMAGDVQPRTDDERTKLAAYLATHHHTSPFRHSVVTLCVEAPEFVARQWYKHIIGAEYTFKDSPWNEVSMRYVVMDDVYQPSEWHEQAPKKKQGASDVVHASNDVIRIAYEEAVRTAVQTYNLMIESGVAREEARMVLPLSIKTRFYWTASLQALAHFVALRSAPDAQSHIRHYAEAVEAICVEHFGAVWEVLRD
jgi:thymidylate synthase (FAD)